MRTLSDRRSVAANTTTGNVLDGKLGQRLRGDHSLRIGATGSAVGLFLQFSIGGETVIDDQEISSANRFPQDPEDIISTPGGLHDDELIARLRNSTGAAITGITTVQQIPA